MLTNVCLVCPCWPTHKNCIRTAHHIVLFPPERQTGCHWAILVLSTWAVPRSSVYVWSASWVPTFISIYLMEILTQEPICQFMLYWQNCLLSFSYMIALSGVPLSCLASSVSASGMAAGFTSKFLVASMLSQSFYSVILFTPCDQIWTRTRGITQRIGRCNSTFRPIEPFRFTWWRWTKRRGFDS